MNRPNRSRWLAPLTLGLALGLAQAPVPAHAQEEVPVEGGEGEGKGRPFDGYFATALLGCLALFVIGKSARR
ncbi:MAG: hypothetical protein AB7I30_05530 [Isosphaeraceae bacterium]